MQYRTSVTKQALFLEVLRSEINYWIPLAIISFFLASVLVSGWPAGIIPEIHIPLTYGGDGLSHSWLIKRVIEGPWYFQNDRNGYPFGSNFLDYPGSDAANFLVLKVLGMLSGSYQGALNLYYLSGFSVTAAVSYIVLRVYGLSKSYSAIASIVYILLPFHFERIDHLFYMWYFVAPLYFYYGFLIFLPQPASRLKLRRPLHIAIHILVFIILSSFGVYFAVFGVIILASASLAGFINNRSSENAIVGASMICAIIFGVLINIAPNIKYKNEHGSNPEVANRQPFEVEYYGLKLTLLVLPRIDHPIQALAKPRSDYIKYLGANGNFTNPLGAIGAVGIFLLLFLMLASFSGRLLPAPIPVLIIGFLSLFLFATIGGFSSLFSMFISPSIRGWDRVNVLIGFAAIATLFYGVDGLSKKYLSGAATRWFPLLTGLIIIPFAVWDQVPAFCKSCELDRNAQFASDQKFINEIERKLTQSAAVFQLPYIPFPESVPVNELHSYVPLAGFLHSKSIKWSSGGMKGREGDLFYRALSGQPTVRQIDVARRLGFSGIYIDLLGYEDKGVKVMQELDRIPGVRPVLTSANKKKVFYLIENPNPAMSPGTSPEKIKELAGFIADADGERVVEALSEGVDFSRRSLPTFIKRISGLSEPEVGGRWSDANLNRSVIIDFSEPLPKSFTLGLSGKPYGPNAGKSVTIKVGKAITTIEFTGCEEKRIQLENPESSATIEIIPPFPTEPELDPRKIGIALKRLWIE